MKHSTKAVLLSCLLACVGCGDSEEKKASKPKPPKTTATKTVTAPPKDVKPESKPADPAAKPEGAKNEAAPAPAENQAAAVKADHEIKMLNAGADGSTMVFEPSFLQVKPGESVKFVSTDPGHKSESYFTPEGGATWVGELGKDVVVTLDKEGVYLYQCQPHLVMGMVGIIQVGNATNKDAAIAEGKKLSAKFVMNKDRLDKYMEQLK